MSEEREIRDAPWLRGKMYRSTIRDLKWLCASDKLVVFGKREGEWRVLGTINTVAGTVFGTWFESDPTEAERVAAVQAMLEEGAKG